MKSLFVLTAALAIPASVVAAAENGLRGRWSISLQGGTDIEASGHYLGGGQGAVLGLPTTIEAQGNGAIHGHAFRGSVSVGYGVSRNVELFARGGRSRAEAGGSLQVGIAETLPLLADFAPYEEWGTEAGLRYYFASARGLKPYVAGVGGVRFLDAAPIALSVPEANVFLPDLALYDKSTVGVLGADVGVSYDLSRHVSVGGEVGLRCQTKASGIDTSLAGTDLETINDGGSRWSVPIQGHVTLRF